MDPDQTAFIGSSLIRVHSVSLHDKIWSEVYLNIYAADVKADNIFRAKTYWQDHGLLT